MTVKMKVYSDFICPFCFLAKGPLDEVVKEKDVEIEWMPFELRPSPYSKIDYYVIQSKPHVDVIFTQTNEQ